MIITWLGHSCFLIENSLGKKILIDPYSQALGRSPYKGSIDILTISHDHFDHNCTNDLNPGFITLNSPGIFQADSIKIQGLPSYHDNVNGFKRGNNVIFVYEIDNFRLCHLGDLGHMLKDEVIDLIGTLDVLFIPIGSNFTLSPEVAYNLCTKVKSKIVIPMHYKTPTIIYPVQGIENFIALTKNAMKLNSNTLIIDEPILGINQVKLFQL